MYVWWEAWQLGSVWDSFYASCDSDTQEALDRRLDQLLEKGNLCKAPVTKYLDDGIFELRAKKARVLFYFGPEKTIVFVHAIIKDRSAVARKDINLAIKRRALIKEGREITYDLTR